MKRVILKLSGEALAGEQKSGYDDALIADIARQVKAIIDKGIDVGVVIGGGNYWRGRSNDNIDRTKADQIGMLATIMNCIYVSEIFRSEGLKTPVCLDCLFHQLVIGQIDECNNRRVNCRHQ